MMKKKSKQDNDRANLPPYKDLLLDLDGTLLDIDMEVFIPRYIQALIPYFQSLVEAEKFSHYLLGATQVMIENEDALKTNREVFFSDFCRRTGCDEEVINPLLERFYEETFPQLKKWSKPHPHASAVIAAAKRKKLRLVLATNPIFPLQAIRERLTWAGLSSDDFALITSIENMHFCKPSPAYYQEIISLLDTSPHRCLMAGNDVIEDLCAGRIGMDTFLVEDHIIQAEGVEPHPTYRGSLADLAKLLEQL